MTDKLTLQDFTYLINILKDKSKWELKELTKLLNVEIESLMYMLNIMSEIYSINGETFIDFEIDLANETISFEYSTNPGKCLAEHVGVNAPGTEKTTIFLSEKYSATFISITPSELKVFSVTEGILSPLDTAI